VTAVRGLALVWPEGREFDGQARLLDTEKVALELELGAHVRVVRADPGSGPRWVCRVDPAHVGPPVLRRRGELIESVATDAAGLMATFSLRHTWSRTGRDTVVAPCADLPGAVARITDEVADTFPRRPGLDWARLVAEHAPVVLTAADPMTAAQEWVARLGDAHTAVHPDPRPVPLYYAATLDAAHGTTLLRVPESSPAFAAGVRPGWRVRGLDTDRFLRTTSAPPHMRPYAAARRSLSSPAQRPHTWRADPPDGRTTATWTETPTGRPHDDLVSWRRLASGAGHLVVRLWAADAGIPDAIDAAFDALTGADPLVLDLRGNVGGNYLLALATRDRFLRGRTTLGSGRCVEGAGIPVDLPRPAFGPIGDLVAAVETIFRT
jgi:carboxyl-terminal processing protease